MSDTQLRKAKRAIKNLSPDELVQLREWLDTSDELAEVVVTRESQAEMTITSPMSKKAIRLERYHSDPISIQLPPSFTRAECYQYGFWVGANVEHAYSEVEKCVHRIDRLINGIAETVLFSESLANTKDWQQNTLRGYFDLKVKMTGRKPDKALVGAVYDFRRQTAILSSFTETDASDRLIPAYVEAVLNTAQTFIDGFYNFMDSKSPNHDNGESLRNAIKQYGRPDIEQAFVAMRDLGPRVGRKSEPEPVTALILIETRKLKRANNNRTRGVQMELYRDSLETRADVQAWQLFKTQWQTEKDQAKRKTVNISAELKNRSVEVQAFEKLLDKDRSTLNNDLETMQDNNSEWIKKQGG